MFTFNGAAISWRSKRQTCNTRSTAESELVALDLASREGLWLRKTGMGLDIPTASTLTILEDNQSCEAIANGSKWSDATKHIATKYFAVREDIHEKRLRVTHVDTVDNVADCFTKPLGPQKFLRFRRMMGVVACRN